MKTVISFLSAFIFCSAFIGCSEEVNRPFKDKTSSTEQDFKFLAFEVGDTTVKIKWDSQGFGESDTLSLFYDKDIVGANGTAISEKIAISEKRSPVTLATLK